MRPKKVVVHFRAWLSLALGLTITIFTLTLVLKVEPSSIADSRCYGRRAGLCELLGDLAEANPQAATVLLWVIALLLGLLGLQFLRQAIWLEAAEIVGERLRIREGFCTIWLPLADIARVWTTGKGLRSGLRIIGRNGKTYRLDNVAREEAAAFVKHARNTWLDRSEVQVDLEQSRDRTG